MLRAVAILLINLISFGLMAPAVSASAGAQLPACCREHGKHQCAMKMAHSMAQRSDSSGSIDVIRETCPYSPGTWTLASNSQTFVPRGSQVFFGDVLRHPAIHAQTEARYRISFSRSRQKRGPPFLSFS